MNIHIAVFRWKPDADMEALSAALDSISGLASKVPGIVEIAVAENSSRYAEGYTHVVMVRGRDQASIDAYRVHPDHVEAAATIASMEEHGIGVDFETDDADVID